MHFGFVLLSPVGEIAMLTRAAFGIVILCLAIPVLYTIWSSLRPRYKSGDSLDLDALWKQYRRVRSLGTNTSGVRSRGYRELVYTKEGRTATPPQMMSYPKLGLTTRWWFASLLRP